MIGDVTGSYLDSLEEREFDAPFMALLRALGFSDIHLLHGPFEFGKDFIAKGNHEEVHTQFAFQTKAGNLGLSEWNGCRGQIDLLRTNSLAHPAFDRGLPRRVVFVTTGRLVGGAALAAQDYSEHLRVLGEASFSTWDRETLVDMISASPEVGLAGGAAAALLTLLGKADQGLTQESELEEFSRRWFTPPNIPLFKGALEAAVIANRLRREGRLDLASYVGLCLVRAAWASAHGSEPPSSVGLLVANTGRSLFRHYGSNLFNRCSDNALDPLKVIKAHELPSAYVTYPARCLRLVEIVGLLGILDLEERGQGNQKLANFLVQFFRTNPGASHPISDRWAVSLIPPVLFLVETGHRAEIPAILENVIRWVGNHYDSGNLGLAGSYSTPEEEIEYLLGSPFEHTAIHRRSESYVATVVLDLAAMLRIQAVYELARNDFLAVGAMPPVVEVGDTPSQYALHADGLSFEPNMQYEHAWAPRDGWKVAPHHDRAPSACYLEQVGRAWDHLAVSAVLRDRHFLPACQSFIRPKIPVHSSPTAHK